MSNIGIVFNTNKLLEEKMNFFCDYFSFYTRFAGAFFETELENPLSLIEKIISQIENNKEKKKASRYIANYLCHNYFSDNSFLDRFESYKPLKVLITEFKSIEKESSNINECNITRANWIKQNRGFIVNLHILYEELRKECIRKHSRECYKWLLVIMN